MTLAQLDVLIRAVCPNIDGIDSNGVIHYTQAATAKQKVDAQAVMDANFAKLVL